MFQTIFLPHQHGRSALDTSRTLSVPFSIDSRCLLQIGDESPDIYVLISLRLGFRRNFLSVLHPKDTNRKFLRNPNLNEINICICSLSPPPPPSHIYVSKCMYVYAQALEFRTPFFLIWSLPRLWYGSLSGNISLNHLSIFYNISCYNSLVLLTFVSRSSCRITYIYIKV